MVRPPTIYANPSLSSIVVIFLVRVAVIIPVPSVLVPAMIVPNLAAVARPIPLVELLPFIARSYPRRALIRRPGVVSGMPNITIVRWIPVAVHPCITRSRVVRANPNHTWLRRRANPDSYVELRE